MGSEAPHQLHAFLFPLMAQGHTIPMVDIAKLLAARGLKATIILTPLNAITISKTIHRDILSGLDIHIQIIPFPAAEVGLPEGIESPDKITSPEMVTKFFMAVNLLQTPLEKLLEEHHPDFIVADMCFPWSTEVGGKFGIPRIVFHGMNFFSQCVAETLTCYKPYEGVTSDEESFVVQGLPDKIEMTMSQLPDHFKVTTPFSELMEKIRDSEIRSYGILVNSFYELEPAYAEHYKNVMGRRAWHIGPVSLQNRDTMDKAQRGEKSSIDEHYILNWLDSKKPNSVIYICFGSLSRFNNDQLLELALGLEGSGVSFVWVVRTLKNDEEEKFLPEGFEERTKEKGLVIRDWAPQVLILDHSAIGGFMTHCGWNSILEGVSAGVPMITWPMFAEQFYNEKFVTEVLKIGIQVGVEKWNTWIDIKDVKLVKNEKIREVVTQLMGDGKEAENMQRRAKELSEMGERAVEEGGSSYTDLTALIEEMNIYRN